MLTFFLKLIGLVSPELRAAIKKSLDEWEIKAKESASKTDDIIVAFLKMILGF